MPTGANNDLIPVRAATKRLLAVSKGSASYDAAIRALLELVPPDRLRRQLAGAAVDLAPEIPPAPRSPEKQVLIARLAAERRKLWRERGRLVPLGPRRMRYVPTEPETPRLTRRPGRGLPP